MKTNNTLRYTTPTAIAQYPWLNEPDTKFDQDGVYKVNLQFTEHTPELDYILQDLQKVLDTFYNEVIKDPKNARVASKIQKADLYETDEEGNIIMKFKQKAVIKSVKGSFEVKIPMFDSHGKPMTDCKIGGGSKIKLCFSVAPYYVPSTRMCGLSLRPVAVQVVELHEYSQGGTMEAYGFSEEEGGYSAPEDNQEDPPFDWAKGDDLPDVGAGEANNF